MTSLEPLLVKTSSSTTGIVVETLAHSGQIKQSDILYLTS